MGDKDLPSLMFLSKNTYSEMCGKAFFSFISLRNVKTDTLSVLKILSPDVCHDSLKMEPQNGDDHSASFFLIDDMRKQKFFLLEMISSFRFPSHTF